MFTPLAGKSVIVTGASKGIGRGIARAMAAQEARVTLVARDQAGLEAACAELAGTGASVRYASCDVSDWQSVKAMTDEAAQVQGGLDIFCANAGIFPQARLEDLDSLEWDRVLAVNLRSAFHCVKAAVPHLRQRGGGRIVLTSSITGPITGYPGWTHYGASKAGQLGFMRSAALELARDNITINAVMPGNILTEGMEGNGPEYIAKMAATIPLKRLGSVADIANAVLFLASEEAGYITGQQIVIDGGQVLPESLDAVE